MTPNTSSTSTARSTRTANFAEAEQLLRDAAFVMKMTRRVKDDILRSTTRPSSSASTRRPDPTYAALGV